MPTLAAAGRLSGRPFGKWLGIMLMCGGALAAAEQPTEDPRIPQALVDLAHAEAGHRLRGAAVLRGIKCPELYPQLLTALRDPDAHVRQYCCEAVGRTKLPNASPVLIPMLEDPEAPVRLGALRGCAEVSSNLPWEPIAKLVSDPHVEVRVAAIQLLGRQGAVDGVPAVIRALQDPEPQVRLVAAGALGQFQDPRAIEPLLETLKTLVKEVPLVARAVAMALGRFQDPRALEGLLRALSVEEPLVRDQVVSALARLGEVAIGPLAHRAMEGAKGVRLNAIRALSAAGHASVPLILGTLAGDPDVEVAALAVESAIPLGVSGFEVLNRALRHRDRRVRRLAVEVLAESQDPEAIAALIVGARDASEEVRWKAVTALAARFDERSVGVLRLALQDLSERIRRVAQDGLEAFGEKLPGSFHRPHPP